MRTGQLPVQLAKGTDVGIDMLASRGAGGAIRLLVWHAGLVSARARISLPPDLANRTYRITVYDSTHNNFARQGDDQITPSVSRLGTRLVFDMEPDSFMILDSP